MKKTILFQGDSITDFYRDHTVKEPNVGLGTGYVDLIASRLTCDDPEIKVYNRGVSGNRIVDMYARWEEDTMVLDFDILSIFNGINDVGFGLRLGTGASAEKYKDIYDRIIAETLERKPGISLVLCQPFVMPVDKDWPPYGNDIFRNYDTWHSAVAERGEAVRELAEKYGAVFVPLREVMEAALDRAPASHWSLDAIHPSPAGHELIARAWLSAAGHLLKK